MAKDDLRSQLGAFVRSAIQQFDSVREVVVQKSRAGRIQVDVAMLRRKRKEVLAELGGVVAELAAAGKITEETYPELSGPLSALEALDERIADEEERARRVAAARTDFGEDDVTPVPDTPASAKAEGDEPGGDEPGGDEPGAEAKKDGLDTDKPSG